MNDTPKGNRLHIVIAGRRNAGKSTLINALAGQYVAITSPMPGTTTDPVEKTMELAGIGPVVLIDTAGIDDVGETGQKRSVRSRHALDRADLALLVIDDRPWTDTESAILDSLRENNVPCIIVRNKEDLRKPGAFVTDIPASGPPVVGISASTGAGIDNLRQILIRTASTHASQEPDLLAELLTPGMLALLIVPIDSGAPRGRLILPQAQAIRACIDNNCQCLVANSDDFEASLAKLSSPPDLIICDSQVVDKVVALAPPDVRLTTFSVLMARQKGDLADLAQGAAAIQNLRPGDRVLVQEACSHHPQPDDIGRKKIPALLRRMAGGELDFTFSAGKEDFAYDPGLALIVHCGACVITRRHMLRRQAQAKKMELPMTNYGLAISRAKGIIERVLEPFPLALEAFCKYGQSAGTK